MNNLGRKKLVVFYNRFYYAIALLITVAIFYAIFPKQGNFKYEFQKGKPWQHQAMIAPFDFPILKAKEIYEAEKDSVVRNFTPYFSHDELILSNQLSKLEQDLRLLSQQYAPEITSAEITQLVSFTSEPLTQLYENGIIDVEPKEFEPLKGKRTLLSVTNNIGKEQAVEKLNTLKSAYIEANQALESKFKRYPQFAKVIQHVDFNQYLEPNLFYDNSSSEMHLNEMLESIATTRGVVQAGVRIISQGDIVTTETAQILESLKYYYQTQTAYSGWISLYMTGQFLLILALLLSVIIYLENFNRSIFQRKRNFSFILSSMIITFVFAWLVSINQTVSIYIFPISILAIVIRTFLGARLAIYIHIMTTLLVGFLAPNSFEYIFIQIIAGSIAVISLNKMFRRGHLVITAGYLFAAYLFMFVGFSLQKEGNFETINWLEFKWFALSSIFTLITYPLIYIFEKIFGFVSDVRLMELADTNNPLLRKLAEQAPGTFQHSIQVANLAEEAAIQLGANPLLIRTGALYHDVGKIEQSNYFIENQHVGQNPHNEMDYEKSAAVVIDHVSHGVNIARKYKLPELIIDFIKMHHGKGMTRFFYLKYKEENPEKQIDVEKFTYPGPNPQTLETAIVMLADSVEAAARSLPEKNEESMKRLIDQIIDSRISNHELDDAPITFRDINRIKGIFLEKLKTVYHIRIEYPKEK